MARGALVQLVTAATVAVTVGIIATGCSGEAAVPLDELPTSTVTTPHLLGPTDQMRQLARQQCLDDPELDQGEINAVDPADPDQILSSVVVDCDTVR